MLTEMYPALINQAPFALSRIVICIGALVFAQSAMADPNTAFTAGDLVISTVPSFNGGGLDYVADNSKAKNGSANAAALGEGGLQKWVLTNNTWTLDYDLVNGQVELFATSYGLNELSRSFLYGIKDTLSATSISQVSGEQFTPLYADTTGQTSICGVAFAPTAAVPEPETYAMMLAGLGLIGFMFRSKKSAA